ncbi:MAG: DUF177 domain-containing protein [Synergistaceae bacterium]|nr:DUF177 domain-containing protein [Synergistaceae bacterium]
MKEENAPDSSLIIELPPRNDTETQTYKMYGFGPCALSFMGQEFNFPEGIYTSIFAQWLEDSLLSVVISIKALMEAPCARCLKTVSLEISDDLRYLYYLRSAKGDDSDEDEEEIKEFDDYMPVEVDYFGRVLDVMPQVSESVFALLPTKVLCKEDCKGLCPNCGKDLNEGECDCKNEDIDPRLDALRNFNFNQ